MFAQVCAVRPSGARASDAGGPGVWGWWQCVRGGGSIRRRRCTAQRFGDVRGLRVGDSRKVALQAGNEDRIRFRRIVTLMHLDDRLGQRSLNVVRRSFPTGDGVPVAIDGRRPAAPVLRHRFGLPIQ